MSDQDSQPATRSEEPLTPPDGAKPELTPEELQERKRLEEAAALFGLNLYGPDSDGKMFIHQLVPNPEQKEVAERFIAAAELKRQGPLPEGMEVSPEFVEDFVKALMHVPYFQQYEPSDRNRDTNSMPLWTKECNFIMWSGRFWPSKSLTGVQSGENRSADIFWEHVALLIFKEAEKRLLVNEQNATIEYLQGKTRHKVVSEIRSNYSVRDSRHLYFNYDTAANASSSEITGEVEAVKAAYMELLEKRVREIVSDKVFMMKLYQSASIFKQVEIDVVLQQDIRLVDRIRSQAEPEEDRKLFLSFVKQAIKFLPNCEEAEIELLTSQDAILLGCKGLHRTSRQNPNGTVYVSMSDYHSGQLRSWDEVMQTLAHEAAHYQMIKSYYGEDPRGRFMNREQHSQRHEMLTYQNLAILRGVQMELTQDPEGGLEGIKVTKKSETPPQVATQAPTPTETTKPTEIIPVDGTGSEESPIALAREALEAAQEAKRIAEEASRKALEATREATEAKGASTKATQAAAQAQEGTSELTARVEGLAATGTLPNTKTEAQKSVEETIFEWKQMILSLQAGSLETDPLKIQKQRILGWLSGIERVVGVADAAEFNQEFREAFAEFKRTVEGKGATWWNTYTKATHAEILGLINRLIVAMNRENSNPATSPSA